MAKVIIADNSQGNKFVIKASSVKNAKKRFKKFLKNTEWGSGATDEFDYEIVDLI